GGAKSRPAMRRESCEAQWSVFRRAFICARPRSPPPMEASPLSPQQAATPGAPARSTSLHAAMIHETAPRHTAIAAAEAFARKRGIGQDFAHVFIATARNLGIPARYERLFPPRRRQRARERPRLGGSLRARARLGRLRRRQWGLWHRGPCES